MNEEAAWLTVRILCLVVLLALVLTPLASPGSVPVEADLEVAGSVSVHGHHDLELTTEHLVHHSWHMKDPASMQVTVEDALVMIYDLPAHQTHVHQVGPWTGFMRHTGEDPQVRYLRNWTGSLRLLLADANETALVVEPLKGSLEVRETGHLNYVVDPVSRNAPWTIQADDRSLFNQCLHGTEYCLKVQSGSWMRARQTGDLVVSDALRAWFYGGVVRLDNGTQEDVWTGRYDETLDEAGPYEERRLHNVVLMVESRNAVATMERRGSDSWAHVVSKLAGRIDGDLELREATGQLLVNDTWESYQHHIVQVKGNLTVDADFAHGAGQWNVEGTAHTVLLDTLPSRNVPQNGFPIEAMAAATVLAVLLAALWKLLPRVLVSLRWGTDPLGNETRMRIARLLTRWPGIGVMDLARETGVVRGTIRYHLKILQRGGVSSVFGEGKKAAHTLNGDSAVFNYGDWRAIDAFRAVQGPHRRPILELASCQPIDYDTYQQVIGGGLTAPRFSEHCQALAEAGLLEREQRGKRVYWRTTIHWQELRRHYVEAFLIKKGWKPLWTRLCRGPVAEERVEAVSPLDAQATRQALHIMGNLGLINYEDGKIIVQDA